jgi:hypothetical protein
MSRAEAVLFIGAAFYAALVPMVLGVLGAVVLQGRKRFGESSRRTYVRARTPVRAGVIAAALAAGGVALWCGGHIPTALLSEAPLARAALLVGPAVVFGAVFAFLLRRAGSWAQYDSVVSVGPAGGGRTTR